MFSILLSSFFVFQSSFIADGEITESYHAAAWKGHFSAQNFQDPTERKQLIAYRRTLSQGMNALPKAHTKQLKKLELRNKAHYSRGMANHEKLILNTGKIKTRDEFMSVFIHEMGHIVDLGHLKGTKGHRTKFRDGKRSIFSDDPSVKFYRISWINDKNRRRGTKRKDFVSGYAMSDPFEDFSESYLFYRLHGDKFRHIARTSTSLRRKYDFLRTNVFNGEEFQTEKQNAQFTHGKLWDATLLPITSL